MHDTDALAGRNDPNETTTCTKEKNISYVITHISRSTLVFEIHGI